MASRIPITIACVAMGTSVASACEFAAPRPQVPDPAERRLDHSPPTQVAAVLAELEPGDGIEVAPDDGVWCKGDAYATIRILEVEDDRTHAADFGFTVTVVDGAPPPDFYVPRYPVLSREGYVTLYWLVGRPSRIAPVDFTIVITATDLAGNEGPASKPIRIHHEWVDN